MLTNPALHATALYAAILVAMHLVLVFKVGAMRGKTGITMLHGDNMELATAIRRHGNFLENVPLALILMGIIELNGGNATLLHVLGTLLVLARIAHPLGLHADRPTHPLRAAGAGITLLVLLVLGGVALWQAIGPMLV